MKSIFTSFAASTLLAALAFAQPHYTVTDLGALGGPGTNSNPFGINAFGWAAGTSNLAPNGPNHAFLWFGGGRLFDLGTLGGQKCTTCNAKPTG
jgi:probable HAF family extracellular repeat protein